MSQNRDSREKMELLESRFQEVPCSSIVLHPEHPQRKYQMEKWLGVSCRDVFSMGFSMFQRGELDHKKVNAFCAENLIRHILSLGETNHLTPSDLTLINELLEKKLLPYFLKKYPLSEESASSLSFAKKIVERDNKLKN